MTKTLGQYLDDPNEFLSWINNVFASFLVLNATVNSGMLENLGDEPATIDELATASGIPADKLARLVDFLAAEEVVSLSPDGKVSHTARSRSLPSIRTLLACFTIYFEAGVPLHPALLKGITAYEMRFGKPVFEHLGENPEIAQVFAQFMAHMTTLIEEFVFSEHRFEPFDLAVDVGGSHGGLLLNLLSRYPDSRGVLFELPDTAAMVADSVRKAEHGDRIEVVGGSFFESVPAGDLYLLKMILHDWNDEECIAILKNIRKAIAPGGRVTVIDYVMPETPRPHPGNAMDLAMMVWATGRERKLSEFKSLFDTGGFAFDRLTENPKGQSVVEAVAV
jgi:hypothetical protein